MGVEPANGASTKNHCAVLGGGEGGAVSDVEVAVGGTVRRTAGDKEPGQGERKSVSAASSPWWPKPRFVQQWRDWRPGRVPHGRPPIQRQPLLLFLEVAVPNPFRPGPREAMATLLVGLGDHRAEGSLLGN